MVTTIRVRSVRGRLLLIGCFILGLCSIYYLDLSSTLLVVDNIDKTRSVVHSCEDRYVFMRNRIVSNDNDVSRKIPKRIHFIVPSRCIPMDVAASINSTWYTLEDHSIYFHDPHDIREYTLKGKEMFPSLEDAFLCAKYSRAKFEIARFAILWELGGIAIDIHQIPHSSILTNSGNVLVKEEDECVFENSQGNVVNPRFIACAPQHTVLYVAITLFVNQFNMLHQCFNQEYCSMEQLQDQMYLGFMFRMKSIKKQKGHDSPDNNSFPRKYFINQPFFLNMKITQIYTPKGKEALFTPMKQTTNDLELKVLSPPEYENQCKPFMVYDNTNDNDNTMESLMEVLVGKENVDTFQKEKRTTGTCSKGLQFVPSRLDANTNTTSQSKIPKIIHMTSKSYCFTNGFVKNIEKWFVEGYSFFLHDDDAVDRLFYGREWPQFPLLREALACIPSGAGKADLWRYLLLWEYGGIYTDMDNAPGSQLFFPNHTSSITDDMDAFFEQERGGFPSQYFFATSPHHPIMYFAVTTTISRLLDTKNVLNQYVPYVTGPGAIKTSFILAAGTQGYPPAGLYPSVHNRTVSVVGSPEMAKYSLYVARDSVRRKNEHFAKMNMVSYGEFEKMKPKPGQVTHSCILEFYHKSTNQSSSP